MASTLTANVHLPIHFKEGKEYLSLQMDVACAMLDFRNLVVFIC